MPIQQRILLVLGALFVFAFVTRNIRNSKILMSDAIFWVILSGVLVVIGAFPELVIWMSARLGFMSPSNFVYLVVVALLLVKLFDASAQISLLTHKVEELAQEIALRDAEGARGSGKDHNDLPKES